MEEKLTPVIPRTPCKFFARGKCNRGDECTFIHNIPEKKSTKQSRVVEETKTTPDEPATEQPVSILSDVVPVSSTSEVPAEKSAKKVKKVRGEKKQAKEAPQQPKEAVEEEPVQEGEYKIERPKKENKKKREPRKHEKLVKVNTETFEPSHAPPDMRIVFGAPGKLYSPRDVILAPSLFCEDFDYSTYNSLLQEIESANIPHDDLWKLWHGDSHLIADDHVNWKAACPTFTSIITKLGEYFQMDIKATRFNWYRDNKEWKPYHFDAAAVDPKKAKTQNMTIGVSFGAVRDIAFEHGTTKTRVSVPLANGMTYGFSQKVNVDWRHGVPQIKEKEVVADANEEPVQQDNPVPAGRISIIAWGYCKLTDE